MFANTQLMGVDSELGAALSLNGFTGQEGLSQLFSLELDLIAKNGSPDVFAALLGKPISVNVGTRHYHGLCSRISQGESNTGFTAYRAEVVPWLWRLTRGRNTRSFQNLSVPEIAQRVAADQGQELEQRLQASYEKREYVVQYRESDFDFLQRLLAEEGIYYTFEQSPEGHELVLVDGLGGHSELAPVRFDSDGELKRGRESIYSWEKTQEVVADKATVRDAHFELPGNPLEASAQLQESLRTPAGSGLELYDYPGGYAERFDGIDAGGGEQPAQLQKLFPAASRDAALRLQAEAAAALQISGASSVRALTAGRILPVSGDKRLDGKYLITSVSHRYERRGDRVDYRNTFTCIPDSVTFRSPRSTALPFVGMQTAFVVGPPGETSFHDKYGRVKVKFPWLRDDGSSRWVRVAQLAGGGRGFYSLPEVGDEVLVAFEHGDPDRPVIVGSVWNAEKPPPPQESPQELPDNG